MGKVEEIIEFVIKDEGIVISPEDLQERTEFLRGFLNVFENLEQKDSLPNVEDTKKMINDLVEKNKGNLTEKEIAEQKKVMEQVYIEGKTPVTAMGINAPTVDMIYNEATRLYNAGKYQDALGFFRLLDMIVPNVPKFCFGAAACYHMLNKYSEAVGFYLKCAYYDKESPIPYYHIADCFLKMKNYGAALGALSAVINRSGGDPKYEKICGKSKLMMEEAKRKMLENPPVEEKK